MTISAIIFYIGAGIMAAPFYLLGYTNYYAISIIVCLMLCPLLSNIAFLVSIFTAQKKAFKGLNTLAFVGSLPVTYKIYSYYRIEEYISNYSHSLESAIFNLCKDDLTHLSKISGTDYFTVNIVIYMIIFPLILLYPWIIKWFKF